MAKEISFWVKTSQIMNSVVSLLLIIFTLLCSPLSMADEHSLLHVLPLVVNDTTNTVKVPINTGRSQIMWKGTEMWETGKHEGTVNLGEGYLLLKNGQIAGGHFVADMNSIAITDIPASDPVPRKRLRNHLESEDFFYVEKYPIAEFEITKTEAMNGDSLRVWGDLSIRDVTKYISFVARQKSGTKSDPVFHTTFKIDRFAWNISYQGSYWKRITSILDNTFVDADISLSIELVVSVEINK